MHSPQPDMEILLPQNIFDNNRRLVQTRWLAVVLLILATVGSVHLLQLPLWEEMLYLLAGVIALYNAFLGWLTRHMGRQRGWQTLSFIRRAIAFQVMLDWLCMLVFVHLTGGVTSPALFFFFIHVIMVTILLPGRLTYIYATVVIVAVVGLSLLEALDVLHHHTVLPGLPETLYHQDLYILATLVFFSTGIVATSYITASIMKPLRQRERQLIALYQTTHAVSVTLSLTDVLQHLATSINQAMDAAGVVIRLLDFDGRTLRLAATAGGCSGGPETMQILPGSVCWQAIQGETLIVEPHEWQRCPGNTMESAGITSIMLIPIKAQQTGVIIVYSRRVIEDTSSLRSFIRAMAGEGAIALDHALAHQALQRAEKQREQFVRIVTHELRAPVTGSQSLLRVMLANMAGDLTDRQRDMLERLNQRMESLLVLINDLLSLAASRARDLQQALHPISITQIVDDVVEDYHYSAADKEIVLNAFIPKEDLKVIATEEGMKRILVNLVGNAIKYTPQGGEVTVTLDCKDQQVQVSVEDTGIGIPPDALEKLGQEFFRAQNAKSSSIVGTGLGLATVQNLLESFNGSMQVDSTPDVGSTFTIKLPLYKEHA